MAYDKPVYIVQHNHFDPIWRRCWDRTFDYKGKRYRSYAELEERFFNIWLENAKKGATLSEGQAVVFRMFLERNPDRLEEVQDLVKKGVIELTGAGETVADTNMPSGETLLRNLVMGQRYFEDTFGVIPSVGWIEDAFGQSAQIPQLFRGVECTSIQKRCYQAVPGKYWKGLDGSVLFVGDPPGQQAVGGGIKIQPCPDCNGVGCEKCDQTGQDPAVSHVTDGELIEAFAREYTGEQCNLLQVGGEEAVPNPKIVELVEEAKQKHGVDFRFGGYAVTEKYLADEIAKIDDPDIEVSDQREANCTSTGCYVTRIRIKQELRRVENLVNTAERWASVANAMGADYPTDRLEEAWRNVIFCCFHDAITSTHIDAAYFELLDMLQLAEAEANVVLSEAFECIEDSVSGVRDSEVLMVYNSDSWERDDVIKLVYDGLAGCPTLKDSEGNDVEILDAQVAGSEVELTFRPPKVGPLGYAAIEVADDSTPVHSGEITKGPGEIENEFFKIKVSDQGIESIFDKRTGKETLDTSKYLGNELILEEDIGHPWGTMQPPSFEERLGQYTTGVEIRRAAKASEITLTGIYKGKDENTKILSWRQSVKLYKGVDRIEFHTEVDWDTAQRRIRVAFPTNIKQDEGVYAIPYGTIERGAYEPDMGKLCSTNGDWPAVNWVDIHDAKEDCGVALVNTGTPSHKIIDGVMYLSLLRSPTDSWCLNEPHFYDCPDFDGARDAGFHGFDYVLVPHQGDYRTAGIEKIGREINNPLVCRPYSGFGEGDLGAAHSFMSIDAPDNVVVTAIKKADRDDSFIVRLAETAGQDAEASVSIEGAGEKVSKVNFLERNPEPVSGKVKLTPFKIVTLQLSK